MKQIWIVIQDRPDHHPSIWAFDSMPAAVERFNDIITDDGEVIARDDEWTVFTGRSWIYLRNPEVE